MSVNAKNHLMSLAMPHVKSVFNHFANAGSQKDSGKVAAELLEKGPFDIPRSPSQKLQATDPLKLNSVQYPLDLGSNELGHYMIFEAGFLTYQPQQQDMFNSQAAVKPTEQEIAAGTATQYTKDTQKITSKIPEGSIANTAICIYMPPGIKVGYNQSYDNDTETGIAGDVQEAMTAAKSAEDVSGAIISAFDGLAGSVFRQAGTAVGEFVSMAGAGDPVRFTMKRFGTAINPRNEAYYNTPTQRTFNYTFDFWPRSKKEAEAVEQIILLFKINSAPGLTAGDGLFQNPNYFKISYMYNGEENQHLHKIGACYCTDVSVDYSPDGQFTTFEGGQPVHTKLTVSFLEDRIITKADIERGA